MGRIGIPGNHVNPVDGTPIPGPPMVDYDEAMAAVAFACGEHDLWTRVDLDERRSRVSDAVDALGEHHDLLALLLAWEIGKPWRLACADVERCIDGVRWYLGQIERQLLTPDGGQRRPLPGPVSNVASWNYPMSVQVHAELVQILVGNAVVAKTPSQGGFHTLTLAHALMRRAGLPVTLISGVGSHLGDVLIRSEGIGALVFVGGRATGRQAAVSLADTGRRHMLEQEGLNAWGVWDFSQWDLLAQHMRKGFEYAKQRCTAYPRYVVQRRLFPAFLDAYLPVVKGVRFGHPLAVEKPDDALPELDFGPIIHTAKAADLAAQFDEGVRGGGIPLYRGSVGDGRFLDVQDTSAYVAPACVLQPPASWSLHHAEPFGPLDSVVVVDTQAELLAAMNAPTAPWSPASPPTTLTSAPSWPRRCRPSRSGSIGREAAATATRCSAAWGRSWKGAFVGGDLLVQALTYGPKAPPRSCTAISRARPASRRAELPSASAVRCATRGRPGNPPVATGRGSGSGEGEGHDIRRPGGRGDGDRDGGR